MSAEVGATWVLLRGLTRESGHWGGFPLQMAQGLRGTQGSVRVLTLDLAGNGNRFRERSPTDIATMVEDLREQLRQAGVQGPVHLLALSLGGMVAAEWAQRHPEELAAAVLVSTSMKPFSPFFRRLRPTNYLTLVAMSLARFAAGWRERHVLQLTSQLMCHSQEVLDAWVALHRRHPVSGLNVLRQLWAAMNYRASRARPRVPMLLLCGQGDMLVDWRCSQAVSRGWGLPLRMHTRAGHDIPLDDPDWVVRAVSDWLAKRELMSSASTPPVDLETVPLHQA
ncbi:alpha/beta hydrolase [Mitsuaria sp. WAJ17]|uniref:alpha/beta fold hydrolase n=1 Tax=Mitsuaria sp. WAJ17 TaxID=2761452 RepID=UPI0016017E0C|nr:alpha/beta hydrolase [Mitsuaria sp. WAJ17]MBB2485785.1 alpha/beta hydrolase [Mitsuaria sp. WAJ17]